MTRRGTWLNREKLAFLAAAAAMAAAGAYAALSRPEVPNPGEHRVARSAPGPLAVCLDAGGLADMAELLRGRDPFAIPPEGRLPEPPDGAKPKALIRPVPEPPPAGDDRSRREIKRPLRVYEVPVNFRAVLRTGEGEPCVVLKTKAGGENRRLVEGDVWPDINLRILRITMSSVLLQDDQTGERFLMRDLYGKKAAAGDRGPGAAAAGA
jgi:hypothetical protein